MLTFEDVTTRGNYYPDKSMATAAVSPSFPAWEALLTYTESTSLPPRYEHQQTRARTSRSED